MFYNYLKITLRNIKKHKGYSFINIIGLSVGMACCILILLWVQDELSYDKFHEHADEIYRVITHQQSAEGIQSAALSPPPLADYLVSGFPEIVNATRLRIHNNWMMKTGNKKFMEDGIAFLEPSFFEIFSFPFIQGDPKTALSNPGSLIITQSMAEKYFGKEDPVGKTMNADNNLDFVITGVIRDIPDNSHISFRFAVSFTLLPELFNWKMDRWTDVMYQTYIQLQKGTSFEQVNSKIAGILKEKTNNQKFKLELQPLKAIHLHSSSLQWESVAQGDIKQVRLFSILAFLVLIMACINFISLTTARGANRAKEVGMRKVTGAARMDIIKQFLGESILFTSFGFIVAIGLVDLLLPAFNGLSGKHITMSTFFNLSFLPIMIGIVMITGFLSGSYPALFLSSFQPAKVLKGKLKMGGKSSNFRKILVTVQFTVSVFLITSTLVVFSQLQYVRNKKLGYDKEHIIYLPVRGDIPANYEPAKNELLKHNDILNVTVGSSLPTLPGHYWSGLDWPGKDPASKPAMWFYSVDFDFIKTFDIKMASGRDYSKDLSTDSSNYIINEAAAKYMGLFEPVGKWFARGEKRGTIIGVVKDFHFETIKRTVEPLVLHVSPFYQYIFVKVRPDNLSGVIHHIEDVWERFNPEFPMEYHFLDEAFDSIYRTEYRMGNLFRYFTALAIFISSLGLLGLASFMTQERTKEIGIRKVLGASQSNIFMLLSKDFMFYMAISNIIGWAIAYISMSKWLQNWAYHTQFHVLFFILAALISFIIVLMSVSYQAIKAALANPVDSLHYE
ncbi:MAG: ABC transporter permease [Thermoplasmata archaeon]|nr:MAG: ABC transporter permease [Thermoplasmata archaeon]